MEGLLLLAVEAGPEGRLRMGSLRSVALTKRRKSAKGGTESQSSARCSSQARLPPGPWRHGHWVQCHWELTQCLSESSEMNPKGIPPQSPGCEPRATLGKAGGVGQRGCGPMAERGHNYR